MELSSLCIALADNVCSYSWLPNSSLNSKVCSTVRIWSRWSTSKFTETADQRWGRQLPNRSCAFSGATPKGKLATPTMRKGGTRDMGQPDAHCFELHSNLSMMCCTERERHMMVMPWLCGPSITCHRQVYSGS